MLTVTNYNKPTPSFGVQVKMGQASEKIGQYLKKSGLKSNHVLIGGLATTGGAAAVSLANPDLIAAPDAAKYGVLGGLASTTGAMFASMRTKETNANTDKTDNSLPTTSKPASPLLMSALGSSLGIAVPFVMSPVVQHNAKKITEQGLVLAEQREKLTELNTELKNTEQEKYLSEIGKYKRENENLRKEITNLKTPWQNTVKIVGMAAPVASTAIDMFAWASMMSNGDRPDVKDLFFLRSLLSRWC